MHAEIEVSRESPKKKIHHSFPSVKCVACVFRPSAHLWYSLIKVTLQVQPFGIQISIKAEWVTV
jgi:hypothetical protein